MVRLTVVLTALCVVATHVQSAISQCGTFGDLNGDGSPNGGDMQLFVDCFANSSTFDARCGAADFNVDGAVDGADVPVFVEFLLGEGVEQHLEYGIRLEGELTIAFIGVAGGRELAAVAFDPSSEMEDFTTERFFGYTVEELETLPEGTDGLLLVSPLMCGAATLWESDFPGFSGSLGQLAILRRQSELLFLLGAFTGVAGDAPLRGTTGCGSGWSAHVVPDFDFIGCCNQHDICYEGCGICDAAGCGPPATRPECDSQLFDCMTSHSDLGALLAPMYWNAVRVIGLLLRPWVFDEVCDDGVSCTLDTCNPQTGCEHTMEMPDTQAFAWLSQDVYGPNMSVVIELGKIICQQSTFLGGCTDCPPPGVCDSFTCLNISARAYIVPHGSVCDDTSVGLDDIAAADPKVIVQASSTSGFWDTVIGVTGPANPIGLPDGQYDVVFDECKDGMFTSGQDAVVATFEVQGVGGR